MIVPCVPASWNLLDKAATADATSDGRKQQAAAVGTGLSLILSRSASSWWSQR
jgi:hypothetical protein